MITSPEPHVFAVHVYNKSPARKERRAPIRFSMAFLQDMIFAPRGKKAKAKSQHAGRTHMVPKL